jgi:hypothetical protein
MLLLEEESEMREAKEGHSVDEMTRLFGEICDEFAAR